MSRFPSAYRAALVIALATSFDLTQAKADSEKIFYAFQGAHDGGRPQGGLIADKDGNLFGTAAGGGSANLGLVFRLTPQGSETILHNFMGGHDGAGPYGALLMDADGNLFGTTGGGGDQNVGTVFRIAPDGTETVLYAFKGGSDGKSPESELIADQDGNLYGTTASGGANNLGTVFKVTPDGTETVVYSFKGGNDGSFPWGSGLWRDANGNLYGTTFQGSRSNGGVVFKISPEGMETILHSFTGLDDGAGSTSALVPDGKGNLYGTAAYGGTGNCYSGEGCGVIFKIASDDSFSVVYSFPNEKAGVRPASRLLIGGAKRTILYGTTQAGGDHHVGTVFRFALNGNETVLHSFSKQQKSEWSPSSPLTADPTFTHLFGETSRGGYARGVVYVLRP